jgi:hypothetical protein
MRLLARCHNGHSSPARNDRARKLTWLGPACSRGDDAVPVAGHKLASENVCTEADAGETDDCKSLLGTHHLRFPESGETVSGATAAAAALTAAACGACPRPLTPQPGGLLHTDRRRHQLAGLVSASDTTLAPRLLKAGDEPPTSRQRGSDSLTVLDAAYGGLQKALVEPLALHWALEVRRDAPLCSNASQACHAAGSTTGTTSSHT